VRVVVVGALALSLVAAGAGAGCTSFGANSTPDSRDAASDAASVPPSATPGRCSVDAPFGPATALGGLGAYSVEAVRFGANRSLVYLSLCPSNGDKTGCDMYQGTITTTADTYGSLVPMAAVNASGAYDSYPTVTGDAKTLIFGSSRQSSGVNIFHASASAGGVFESPTMMALGFAASNEPYLLADGRTFFFAATVSLAPIHWDLYRAEGNAPDFQAPKKVSGSAVNQDQTDELAPVPSEDELEIFFASSRAPGGDANLDMWTAKRASKDEPFGPATRLDDLSGDQNEFPTSLSPDACELYYIRKTGSGDGVGTAYVTRRKKP
jgi:hypothetical protein